MKPYKEYKRLQETFDSLSSKIAEQNISVDEHIKIWDNTSSIPIFRLSLFKAIDLLNREIKRKKTLSSFKSSLTKDYTRIINNSIKYLKIHIKFELERLYNEEKFLEIGRLLKKFPIEYENKYREAKRKKEKSIELRKLEKEL